MYILITTATKSLDSAQEIARTLVENRLAAAVAIERAETFYRWDGDIHHGEEVKISAKTRYDLFDKIRNVIYDLHPYELPQLIFFEINGGTHEYIEWLELQLIPSSSL